MGCREIVAYFQSLADLQTAEHSQRFFKTKKGEYGEGDKFLGIRVPVVRQAVKRYKETPLDVAEELLRSEYHELRLFALLLMVYRFEHGDSREQEEVYRRYLANTRYINSWDLVDSSAPYIVGKYLQDKERDILYTLSASSSLWERRIAILSTFSFIREQEFKETLAIAEALLHDPEDLIHKAAGWMLREVGKRDPEKERAFLDAHHRTMPRTMLRYAIEKLDEDERQHYLKGASKQKQRS